MNERQLEGEFQTWVHSNDACYKESTRELEARQRQARENLDWLYDNMPGYFFITMKNEIEPMANLLLGMQSLRKQRKVILADVDRKLVVARLDVKGSLYDTLKSLKGREISYAEITHSYRPIPGTGHNLEVLRFEFDPKSHAEILEANGARLPAGTRETVLAAMKNLYPDFAFKDFNENLNMFWYNSKEYVRMSPPERIARILWLYQQCRDHNGMFLDVESTVQNVQPNEYRILFAVENPPQQGFLTQAMEVFKRLKVGVRRSYSLNISNGRHRYFLGNFYVTNYDGQPVTKDSAIFGEIQRELYNTQILATDNAAYTVYVNSGIMNGEDASLTNAFASFCQTTLGHTSPDRFSMEAVKDALFSHPDIVLSLISLFRKRFDPDLQDREKAVEEEMSATATAIENYNTGHKHLDEVRRTIYRTCLSFVKNVLKTNFFIPDKQALAFRLDPAYLTELDPSFTSDLPKRRPFRVTFFFGRLGAGYHIGFSDIARGGWRTIISRTQDELTTNRNNIFREVFVLAHTQHLKNKDIYEGGSKLAVILDARGLESSEAVVQQLYKLQYAMLNAFLDIFVTENGKARDPRVVDYYGDDEPIELGPDENMHDTMIEVIARQAVKRGYALGGGIMSSKRVGINHKQYGVTSRGVIRSAMIAMNQVGIDMTKDEFTMKITGGPFGDVAGNSIALLLERCPGAKIVCITDATGALYDPEGADRQEMARIVLKADIHEFNPEALHKG
ncbi:MAG: NAD-glutamate dehydrogenase, partial [Desulfobacteraceae bacterium]|nr:NAD-glutamate dehydrogenase [Desulfobacteraceae bacterium]